MDGETLNALMIENCELRLKVMELQQYIIQKEWPAVQAELARLRQPPAEAENG